MNCIYNKKTRKLYILKGRLRSGNQIVAIRAFCTAFCSVIVTPTAYEMCVLYFIQVKFVELRTAKLMVNPCADASNGLSIF